MSKIYIASHAVGYLPFNYDHAYIVYDPDSDPTNGNEVVIRGGPSEPLNLLDFLAGEDEFGTLTVLNGVKLSSTKDALGSDTPEERHYSELDFDLQGLAVDNVWAVMQSQANAINAAELSYRLDHSGPDIMYVTSGQNSNSVVASLLFAAGVSISDLSSYLGYPFGIWPGFEDNLSGVISVPADGYLLGDYYYKLGGDGDDTISGSSAGRSYVLDGGYDDDVITGNDGNDVLFGGEGNDVLNGAGGSNTADYSGDADGITVNLTMGTATDGWGDTDTLSNIQNVRGSAYSDDIVGDDEANTLFGSIGDDAFDGGDDDDIVDYTRLGGKLHVTYTDAGATVVKGDSAALGTDTLTSVETIMGTDGYGDIFEGTTRAIPDELTYEGKGGADKYIVDLTVDKGLITIIDEAELGLDSITIKNFDHSGTQPNMLTHFAVGSLGELYIEFFKYNAGGNSYSEFLSLKLQDDTPGTEDGIEFLTLSGVSYRTQDIINYAEVQTNQNFDSDDLGSIYDFSAGGWAGGTGGTGAGGGTLPTYESGGNVNSMRISPASYTQSVVPYLYGTEIMHPLVLTSVTWASGPPGHSEVHYETYLKEIAFQPGIGIGDIRFNASSTKGDADLTVFIDGLNVSFTIPDFEAGRTIHGIGQYNSSLHSDIQGASSASLSGSFGHLTGGYDVDLSAYGIGTFDITYFLEKLSFVSGASIDMTDNLTFRGTDAGETIYGLDTRDDTLQGLGGNDSLYGYGGNDTIEGGTGRDNMYGGTGNDTYVFAAGFGSAVGYYDTVVENASEGTDTIRITGGLDADDIRTWADNAGLHMRFAASAADEALFQGSYFGSTGTDIATRIEQVVFDDTTTWDLTQGLILNDTDDGHLIWGGAQADVIDGNGGNDSIYGYAGNDTIEGGAGRDNMTGGTGDDTYVFAAGFGSAVGYYDTVVENASEGTDTIRITGGLDADDIRMWADNAGLHMRFAASAADEALFQGSYSGSTGTDIATRIEQVVFDDTTTWDLTHGLILNDTDDGHLIWGGAQADVIDGNGGNDSIYGYGGNDMIEGGAGRDNMTGGTGNDAYVFAAGFGSASGYDTVIENASEGTDTIRITGGLDADDIRMWADNGGLHMRFAANAIDEVLFQGSYVGSTGTDIATRIEQVVFDDTTTWDLTQGLILNDTDDGHLIWGGAQADVIDGNGGNDSIYGYGGNDMIEGGAGRDNMYGGTGNDTYVFAAGFGSASGYDTVVENASEGTDTIRIGGGLDADDIRMWADNYGLHVRFAANAIDEVLFQGSYSGSTGTDIATRIEQVVFDNTTTWDLTEGLILNDTDDGHTIWGGAQADIIHGNGGNDYIYGYAGNDTIEGGAGRDNMYGGTGNDTYVFAAGFGLTSSYSPDTVVENASEGTDTVRISGGLDADDIRMWADNYGLHMRFTADAHDEVLFQGSYSGSTGTDIATRIEQVVFDDTTTWDLTQGLILNDTDDAHTIWGGAQADVIHGNGGNDYLYGYASDDLLFGGNGADYLNGGGGADTFAFESANAFNNVDTIADFHANENDKIDISDILDGHYNPGTDPITNFVQIQTSGSNSELYVDTTGSATFGSAQHIATISGVTGLTDEAALVTAGTLLAA